MSTRAAPKRAAKPAGLSETTLLLLDDLINKVGVAGEATPQILDNLSKAKRELAAAVRAAGGKPFIDRTAAQ